MAVSAPPTTATPTAPRPNVAHVRAENARFLAADGTWSADIPYMKADVVDLQAKGPLDLWKLASYQTRVDSADVRLSDQQATAMVRSLLRQAESNITNAQVTFKGGKLTLTGSYHTLGVPVPFTLDYQVKQLSPTRVALVPQFSLTTRALLAITGTQLSKMVPADMGQLITVSKTQQVTIDLAALPSFDGKLSGVTADQGRLDVRIGGAPEAPIAANRRRNQSQWVELQAEGEVRAQTGMVKNGTVVVTETKPGTEPLTMNRWNQASLAHVESGDLVVDDAGLKQMLASANLGGFELGKVALNGRRLSVDGNFPINSGALAGVFSLVFGGTRSYVETVQAQGPTSTDVHEHAGFTVRIGLTPDGKVELKPESVRGLATTSAVRSALLGLPGAKADGKSVVLDLQAMASVQAGPFSSLHFERGRLTLSQAAA